MTWHRYLIYFFCFSRLVAAAVPHSAIERHTLNNGLTVVLVSVPFARQIELQIRVGSGWREEDAANRGVAHLLEHTIQRDLKAGASHTYPDRFREEVAGDFQGVTTWKSTSFFVTVPSLKGIWALNEFHRMLFRREFKTEDIDRARTEVWKEIGEPTDPLLHFLQGLSPPQWVLPDFFSTEFAIQNTPGLPEQVRRSTRRLKAEDLNAFYKEHYVPNNMTLYYSGPFKEKETLAFMRETFEREPSRESLIKEESDPSPRDQPYVRSNVTTGAPWLSLGTKFWNIEPQDEMALQLFFESITDRFKLEMAQPNNTITSVEKKIWVDDARFGYAVLNFEFSGMDFAKEQRRIVDLITKKTYYGELTENEVQSAKKKIRKRSEDWEGNSEIQLKAAQALLDFQQTYETEATPLEVLDKLSTHEIKERLTRLFRPERQYLVKHEPPQLFKGESLFLWAVIALLTVMGFRYGFARNFPHTRVRYVRKVRYSPFFFLLSGFVFLNFIWVVCQVFQLLEARLLNVNFIQSSFWISQYLLLGFFVCVTTAIAMTFLGSIPRKILIVDNKLWIKSISFRSRRFSKGMIKTIFCCRPYQLVTMGFFKEWPRLFHWALWKRGLFIELKDGTSYYLGFSDPDRVLRELNQMFHEALHHDPKEAPVVEDITPLQKFY